MYAPAPRRPSAPAAPAGGHAAAVGLLEPGDELEEGGLAAAGRAHDGHHLAGANTQREALQSDNIAAAAPAEAPLDALQRDSLPFKCERLLDGSLRFGLHRSLRGHYPTGSKGQRRATNRRGRYLSPLPASPPDFWTSSLSRR